MLMNSREEDDNELKVDITNMLDVGVYDHPEDFMVDDLSGTGYHIHVEKQLYSNSEDLRKAIAKAISDVVQYRNDPKVNGVLEYSDESKIKE